MTWTLTRIRLVAGKWEGRLTGPSDSDPPPLAAVWRGAEIGRATIAPDGPGCWTATLILPAAVISDGAHAIGIGPPGGEPLCFEPLAFGDLPAGDLRADLAALRTEVEVLKRALRRHLAEDV